MFNKVYNQVYQTLIVIKFSIFKPVVGSDRYDISLRKEFNLSRRNWDNSRSTILHSNEPMTLRHTADFAGALSIAAGIGCCLDDFLNSAVPPTDIEIEIYVNSLTKQFTNIPAMDIPEISSP